MSTASIPSPIHREPEPLGQTVVVIDGSAGIGFETARRAHAEGAKVTLTGRNAESLELAASEVDALSTAAFDAADPVALDRFFGGPPTIDHVMVTAGGPYYDASPIWTLRRFALLSARTWPLAVNMMTSTPLTGATYDNDGGQQFVGE